ncbi:hypothetical protein [Dietzia sp. 179-F 9C3 NHS]|uniref:hypothetical protein n=1 Tax=Dietzia sp. 179-F 9C3 NHS TaxID=3374295 RepID=UPI00387A0A7C
MKKTTRTAAVAAVAALVISGATGTANAQSSGSGDSSLPPGVSAQSVADAIGLGNLGDLAQSIIGTLTGSATNTPGVLAGSAQNLGEGSTGIIPQSSELPPLSTEPLGGSAALPAGVIGSYEMTPLTGSWGMTPLNLLGGSAALPAGVIGSYEMTPLSTELNLLGGSAELPPLSANFPDGSTEGIGGSAELVAEGLGGSLADGGGLAPIIGSAAACPICEAVAGSISGTSGSLTGESGSTGASSDVLTGSFGDLTAVNGSLTAFTGSLANGSLQGTAITNLGSSELVTSLVTSGGGGSLVPLLALGASAGAGALAAGVANGTIQLPPLPFLPANVVAPGPDTPNGQG